jgi:hypothetical protein
MKVNSRPGLPVLPSGERAGGYTICTIHSLHVDTLAFARDILALADKIDKFLTAEKSHDLFRDFDGLAD